MLQLLARRALLLGHLARGLSVRVRRMCEPLARAEGDALRIGTALARLTPHAAGRRGVSGDPSPWRSGLPRAGDGQLGGPAPTSESAPGRHPRPVRDRGRPCVRCRRGRLPYTARHVPKEPKTARMRSCRQQRPSARNRHFRSTPSSASSPIRSRRPGMNQALDRDGQRRHPKALDPSRGTWPQRESSMRRPPSWYGWTTILTARTRAGFGAATPPVQEQ